MEAAQHRSLTLAGVGMGTKGSLTLDVFDKLLGADMVFGAPRIVASLTEIEGLTGIKTEPIYKVQEVIAYLQEHTNVHNGVVVFSGDVGFYSGAKGFLDAALPEEIELSVLPGISTISYFSAKMGTTWQDAKLLSMHGRNCNLIEQVRQNKKCIVLLDGAEQATAIITSLHAHFQDGIHCKIGFRLSYPEEQIVDGSVEQLHTFLQGCAGGDDNLLVLFIAHTSRQVDAHLHRKPFITPGLPDEEFMRGSVPMTKEDVRALALCKLQLQRDSVIWDVGAGTGSVSVECARIAFEGEVYAIEKEREAIELISTNKKHFGLMNMEIIPGRVMEVLDKLPDPTHVFVGGSGGELCAVLEHLQTRPQPIRVVITAVTLETMMTIENYCKENPMKLEGVQVSIAKRALLGEYHRMVPENPVTIYTLTLKK